MAGPDRVGDAPRPGGLTVSGWREDQGSLRLVAQDTALSRLEQGFESPRERHPSTKMGTNDGGRGFSAVS